MIISVNRGAIVLNRGRGDKQAGNNAYRGLLAAIFNT
jgi:TetR/AcrR family transcriptional repressor of nem operon